MFEHVILALSAGALVSSILYKPAWPCRAAEVDSLSSVASMRAMAGRAAESIWQLHP